MAGRVKASSDAPAAPEVERPGAAPRLRTGRAQRVERLQPSRYPPFVHYWTGRYVMTDRGLLPDVRRELLVSGSSGVRVLRDGSIATDGLVYNLTQQGFLVLDEVYDATCVELPGQPGCYGYPWSRVDRGEIVEDPDRYWSWVESLVTDGLLPRATDADRRSAAAQLDRQIGNKPDVSAEVRDTLQRRRALLAQEVADV